MKRFVVAFIIVFAVMTLMAQNNVITYTATEKLPEVTGIFDPGLHPDVFISRITSHTFSNGRGKITFADDVVSINGSAFYGCKGLTSITIPASVISIGEFAFHGCIGLTSIIIPDNVVSIGEGAFYGCKGLTSITITNSVTNIGDGVFEKCSPDLVIHSASSNSNKVLHTTSYILSPTNLKTTPSDYIPPIEQRVQEDPTQTGYITSRYVPFVNIFLFNTSYNIQGSYAPLGQRWTVGFMYGRCAHAGWFIKCRSGFNYDGWRNEFVVRNQQCYLVKGDQYVAYPEYDGQVSRTLFSATGGLMIRMGRPLRLYLGAGYGYQSLNWMTQNKRAVRNEDYSLGHGVAVDGGLTWRIASFQMSLGVATIVGWTGNNERVVATEKGSRTIKRPLPIDVELGIGWNFY